MLKKLKNRKINMALSNYKAFIEENFRIIDKNATETQLILNSIQDHWINIEASRKIELKARQQGFTTIISAKKATKFILLPNRYIVTIADNTDNAMGILERVKFMLKSYEDINHVKVPLKYNSKYELFNEANNSHWIIGTAENIDVGRSKTITDLHISEAAFARDLKRLLAGVLQAVVPDGEVDIETTANGFNEFKQVWDLATLGENNLTPLFYKASEFYSPEFLAEKKKELGAFYAQEYPETPEEAFLTSGDLFFDAFALKYYQANAKEPMTEGGIYV